MGIKVVNIESHNDFKGIHGSLGKKSATIGKRRFKIEDSMSEVLAAKLETTSDFDSKNTDKGVSSLEITPKEYIDDRTGALEKSINEKFVTQEKILAGKIELVHKDIEHLHTKIESSLETRFNSFKTQFSNEQKESRRFLINTILVSVGIATAVIIGVLGFVIK